MIEQLQQLQVGESLIIGRGDVEVCVTDVGVSAKHARIERRDEGFFIRDLASSTGTFVNNKKLAGSQRLKTGDRIKIGKTEWTFAAAEAVAKPVEEPAVDSKKKQTSFFGRLFFGKK